VLGQNVSSFRLRRATQQYAPHVIRRKPVAVLLQVQQCVVKECCKVGPVGTANGDNALSSYSFNAGPVQLLICQLP
jgi:hypothetical protein